MKNLVAQTGIFVMGNAQVGSHESDVQSRRRSLKKGPDSSLTETSMSAGGFMPVGKAFGLECERSGKLSAECPANAMCLFCQQKAYLQLAAEVI